MNAIIAILIMLAVLLAELSQNSKKIYAYQECHYANFIMTPFIVSYIILAGICFCCKSGTDMAIYVDLYSKWSAKDFQNLDFEIGDKLLFIFLRTFLKNPYVGIGIVKVLSIGFVYKAIYLLKDKINIGMSVLIYVVLLYIFNFHLIRMMFALGLVFLALAYELTKKRMRCVLLLVLAFFFHYSSIIVLLTYLLYIVLSKRFSIKKVLIMLLGLALLYTNAMGIVAELTSIDIFSKYNTYDVAKSSGSGIGQIVLFFPVAIVLFINYKSEKELSFYQLALFCGVMSFFVGNLGYVYMVIGRLVYYFYFFFVIYGASTPLKTNDIIIKGGRIRVGVSTIMIYVYLFLQTYIYFVLGNGMSSNGMLKYMTIWN